MTATARPVTRWFGDRAVLVEVDSAEERHRVERLLVGSGVPGEVRSGLVSVLVEVAEPDPGLIDVVTSVLASSSVSDLPEPANRDALEIGVAYDGEDLDQVAEVLGLSTEGLIDAHTRQVWRVAMMGFAPGFGYLEPVDAPLADWSALARRATPRSAVPVGSVAVAAGMSAVYPQRMPGGWHLLGRTSVTMFDLASPDRPSLLRSGDHVRFTRVAEGGVRHG